MSVISSVWGGGTGGGAYSPTGTFPLWNPYKNPTPHAHDDDFDDNSIAAAWNSWDPGSLTTFTEGSQRLVMSQATHGSQGHGGRLRTAPADASWCVTVAVDVDCAAVNYMGGSLVVVGSDAISNPTTCNFMSLGMTYFNNGVKCEVLKYADYATYSATDGVLDAGPFRFLRWFYNSADSDRILALVSNDGQDWTELNNVILSTASLAGGAVAYVGPAINNFNTGRNARVVVSMYRVQATTNPHIPLGGYETVAKV
jgi:hypothetical protein